MKTKIEACAHVPPKNNRHFYKICNCVATLRLGSFHFEFNVDRYNFSNIFAIKMELFFIIRKEITKIIRMTLLTSKLNDSSNYVRQINSCSHIVFDCALRGKKSMISALKSLSRNMSLMPSRKYNK